MKNLLIVTVILIGLKSIAQIPQHYPVGFKKGYVLQSLKPRFRISDPVLSFNIQPPLRLENNLLNFSSDVIGNTKYDLQTNNSILNMISVNSDGTVSACWNFSPDANNGHIPPYPFRGMGYNYNNGNWALPTFIGPYASPRTGWSNIIVTPLGKEMTIQHSAITSSTYSRMILNWRPVKGSGNWTTGISHWSQTAHYAFAKACGGKSNENVYAIWLNIPSGQFVGTLYFSKSTDGGVTWNQEMPIAILNPDTYPGDCYSIDALGDTVAISVGYEYTDLMLLKSTDAGNTWSETLIQKKPIPNFFTCNCNTNYIPDSIPIDTVRTNGGDSHVLIDHNGMCHVWFTALDFHADTSGYPIKHFDTDNLYYWNENMGYDTTTVWNSYTGGSGRYVAIAVAEDFNGNGILDLPSDTSTTCTNYFPCGNYGTGLTCMPSAGIDSSGNLYVSYSTINELADTSLHLARRHVYFMRLTPPYNPMDWTHPINIIPLLNQGGNGELEECVFASMSKRVLNGSPCILYQVDGVPGTSLDVAGSCQAIYNMNLTNSIRTYCQSVVSGISNPDNEIKMELFPNPSNGKLTILIDGNKNAKRIIVISDLDGRSVFHQTTDSNEKEIFIDIENLAAGVYVCKIKTDHYTAIKKFIIQKS